MLTGGRGTYKIELKSSNLSTIQNYLKLSINYVSLVAWLDSNVPGRRWAGLQTQSMMIAHRLSSNACRCAAWGA